MSVPPRPPTHRGYSYEHVPGLFSLSTWDADINSRFGLVARDWAAFREEIDALEAATAPNQRIRVVYTARHGEAEHNVLAAKYGEPEDVVQQTHPITDPPLTERGRAQAIQLGATFERETAAGMPVPTRFFVSPMRRPGETCGLEWCWLFPQGEERRRTDAACQCEHHKATANGYGNGDAPKAAAKTEMNGFVPVPALAERAAGFDWGHGVPGECIEELREHLHVHHCDERLPKSELKALFPSFDFPASMPEEDTVWRPMSVRGRETEDEMVARAGRGLAILMDKLRDEDRYVSLTAHSGLLRAVYKNFRVPLRRLTTGEMNVLVIRVSKGEVV